MNDVVITSVPHSGHRRSRTPAERTMVRVPWAWRALSRVGQRVLRPQTRLRRWWLQRNMISAYSAATRRDFELMLIRYARDMEVTFEPDFEALGLGGTFRGHEGLLRLINSFSEAWEQWDLVPVAVIDMGDRFLGIGRFHLPGTASGLEFESEFAQLITTRNGAVVAEHEFLSWDKGMRAAGLDPDAVRLKSGR